MLNRNDISGDLSDPNVIKRFSQLPDLRYLELGNLPGLTGSLPVACTAPFKNLIHLGLSNTSVGGTLPACIVNNVHQLEIAGARFEGAFPEVTSLCALRYLIAGAPDRDDDSGAPRFSGPMPKLQYATHLHYANLDNHNFEGTLTLSNYIEVARVESNQLTEVVLDHPQRLQVLDVAGNKISTIPDSVAQMTTMLAIHVDGNELKALPTSWRTPHLRDLTASLNKIEVRVCVPACVSASLWLCLSTFARANLLLMTRRRSCDCVAPCPVQVLSGAGFVFRCPARRLCSWAQCGFRSHRRPCCTAACIIVWCGGGYMRICMHDLPAVVST